MYLEKKKINFPDTLSFMQLQSYNKRYSEVENRKVTGINSFVIDNQIKLHFVNVNNSSFFTIKRFK